VMCLLEQSYRVKGVCSLQNQVEVERYTYWRGFGKIFTGITDIVSGYLCTGGNGPHL